MYYFGGAVVVVLVTSEERDEWVVISVFPFWFGGAGGGVVVVVIECGVGWVGYEWMLGDVCCRFAGPSASEVNSEDNKLRGDTLKNIQIP